MFKYLVIGLCAIAVAKIGQKVRANDDLDLKEKRLLQTLEDAIDEVEQKRELDCLDSVECFLDDVCAEQCCQAACGDTEDEDCVIDCMDGDLKKRMAVAAENQEMANNEVYNNNNQYDKKIFGIPPIRRWIPPIPPVRIPPVRIPPVRIPRIPPVRIPRIPPVRIPRIPRIPPIRRWLGKK